MLRWRHARRPYESALTLKLFKWDHTNERRAGRNDLALQVFTSRRPCLKLCQDITSATASDPVAFTPFCCGSDYFDPCGGQIHLPLFTVCNHALEHSHTCGRAFAVNQLLLPTRPLDKILEAPGSCTRLCAPVCWPM